MKVAVKNIKNEEVKKIDLPMQFNEDYRPDLIIRAVLSLQSRARQPYGAKPGAGKRASAELSRRRRKYRGSYGFGISRVPRKILSRRGTRMNWVGAFAPGMVGGRRAHPPKAEKIWEQKINKKENRKAIRSALSATINKELVLARGHKAPKDYPFIISDEFESIKKTNELMKSLIALNLSNELIRCEEKKIRAGKGTMRGRPYKKKKGPLLVISKEDAIIKSASNIPGIDVVVVDKLNAELLSPGTHSGRLTLYTESAIRRIDEEKLFTNNIVKKNNAVKKNVAKKNVKSTKVTKNNDIKKNTKMIKEIKEVREIKEETKIDNNKNVNKKAESKTNKIGDVQ